MEPFQPPTQYVLGPPSSDVKWQEMRLNNDLHLESRSWIRGVIPPVPYSPVPVFWNLQGHGVRKDEGKRRGKVWGLYLFYGTRCQWKLPVPNTLTARILGGGTVTLMKVINTFAHIVVEQLQWSRGSVLAFGTQVRGFKPGRSRRIFRVKKSSARLPLEGK
jgi:hypothetical protein